MTRPLARAARLPLVLLALSPTLTACAQHQRVEREPIVLDARFDDWPADTAVIATPQHLFLRFSPPGDVTLQGGQRCTRVLLDLDADASTGDRFEIAGADPLGADLEIQISPLPDEADEGLSYGVSVIAHGDAGARIWLSHADVGLLFSPTYAADAYELRLDRAPAYTRPPEAPSLEDAGPLRGLVVQTDADADELWRSDLFATDLPPARAGGAHAGALPAPGDAVRVVSHNVLRASPAENPEPFARLYRALDPDVILLQEWDAWSAERLAAWFDQHVPSDSGWHAVAHPAQRAGVAVVSRFPISLAVDEPMYAGGARWPVRFVAALVETPDGPLLAGSMHLKCCGHAGSPEDEQRTRETRAINALLRRLAGEHDIQRCVLGGDLNLVGSRPPLDVLRDGLDADASDLEPARALVWGEASAHTWTDADSAFSPGRLDWLVYSDASLASPFACALDTAELSREALDAMGLRRDDSRASDHLPLVVDLVLKR